MVLARAWAYVRLGALPAATWLLYGVTPVVIALIVEALWLLGHNAIMGPLTAVVGSAVFGLYFLGFNEIGLLFAGGLTVMLVDTWHRIRPIPPTLTLSAGAPLALALTGSGGPGLQRLFLTCLKIGSVLYGSGYVLLAFLRADFVVRLGWLMDPQLIDAVAVGQLTPGPLFTTATFIGYLVGSVPGPLLASLGIFLPSFIFVAATPALVPRMRQSIWLSSRLDGVIVALLGLMEAVTVQIGRTSRVDPVTVLVALVAVGLLWRTRLNSTWLILASAPTGVLADFLPA